MEEIDALPDPTGGPATLLQESAIGTGPVTPPPTQPELTHAMVDVFNEVKTAERRSGRPGDAEAEAWAAVTGIRRQVPQGEQTQLLPAGSLGQMAQKATEPGTMGRRAAEAFSPRWFSEKESGIAYTAGWRVAVGQEERERAANLRAARDISFGVPADAAKKEALRRLNAGEALVLPTPLNKGTATAQTDQAFDKIAVPDTAGQALADIARGGEASQVSLANTVKDVTLDASLLAGEAGARGAAALGVPFAEGQAERLKQLRNWQIPDPIDALVKWGDETPGSEAIPGLGHLIAAYRDTAAREGGVATGAVSLAGIDPNADGTLNAIARVVAARPKRPEGTEPVNAEEVLRATADTSKAFAKDWYKAANTGVEAIGGDASAADVGAASARALASGLNAVKTPVMTGFEAVTYTPEMRETSLGYYMRVGGSALQAMVTTPLARITDAALVSMGAESYRRHRTPTDDKSWTAVLNPGEVATDYLTAVYNGDSFTSETMRVLDTLAQGTDWFSPETTASMLPGGTTSDIVTGIAATADLFLPVDHLPIEAVRAPLSRGMRFYDGFAEGRALRMAPAEAATMGAARAFPGATDRALAGDALYEEGRQKLSGEADRPAPPAAVPTRDRDASTVVGAATYAWTRRQLDRGIDPREALRATGNVGHKAIADALDEVFTVLGTVEDGAAQAAPPTGPAPSAPSPSVPAPTTPPAASGSPLPSAPPRAAPASPPPGPSVIVSTAAPTTGPLSPARQHLLDFATAAHAVAAHDHPPPLTKWSPGTDAEPDVARRRGLQLKELAAHLHATPDAARGLLQAAAAYTDPRSGRFVTIPWPSPDGLERITDNHIDIALNRLRKASPEQVWRNAIAYENGAHPFWTDEVSPARQRAYMALTSAIRETALSSDDVRTYMALGDRMAAALVRNGVLDTIDAFWAAKEYTTAKAVDKRVGGWVQFRKDAAALIHLAETADLSTLLHEDAHLLRSLIPADQMADIDAYVKQRWGGWTREAEEWFAEQMESVWAKGELTVPLAEQARNPTLYDRIKRALSTAAGVLTELLRGRVVEDIHPTVDAWMKSWLHLTAEDDPIVVRKKSGEHRGPPGWDEARVVSIETRVADVAALPEGKPRRAAIHKIINDFAYWSGMGKEAAKALRDANKEGNDLAVAQDMAKRARAGVKGAPAPAATVSTPPAPALVPAPPVKAAVAAPPPLPVAPPVAAPAMAQPARATVLSADVLRRADEAAAGSENASRGVTRRRVLKVLDELVKDGAVVTEADRADLDADIKAAYRKHPPGKDVTQDAPRSALVKKAVDRVLRRLALPAAPPRVEPSAPPAVLDDIQAPVEPYEPAAAAPPKSEDLPIGGAGNAWTTYRGQPRALYDRNGRGYKVVVMLSPLDSLLASHDMNGTPTKGYNQALQNRLNADQRHDVLVEHAHTFVPDLSLTIDTPTPTVGTMTTWRETPDGPLLTAAGNGRLNTVRYIRDAALRGEPWAIPAWASIQAHVDLTARALGLGNAEPGDIVHFHLVDADEKAALEFAENSQDTPTEEMIDTAIIAGHAETIRRSDARVILDIDKLPPELNEATVAAYVAVDPIGFDKAIAAMVPSAAEREGLVNTPTKFLQAVKGVLLGQIDRETQKAIAGNGKAALDRLITATPAILALDAIAGTDPAMETFRVGDYYRDAEELVRYGRSKKAVTPKALALTALNLATSRTLTAATPLPVSKVSFALACAILQKETPGGVFQVLRELSKEAVEFKKPKMFGAPDPVAAVVDALTAGTKNAALVPAELPGTHAEAVANAEGLAYQSLAAKVERGEPVPTEPPGYQKVLEQHRAYTAAAEATASSGALRTDTTLRDTEPTFAMASVDWRGPDFTEAQARAAAAGAPPVQARILNAWADELARGRTLHSALNRTMPSITHAENADLHAAANRLGGTVVGDETVNPYGVIAAGLRAKPLLTREQMNLALGYRADQSTYEGKDLTARALAWVTVNRLQGQQMPRAFALVGNRVSVPVTRAAGVRARGIAILGDLPKAVHAAVHTVTATGTVPGTRGIGAGREAVRLAPVDAARFMVIRDYLTASGWADSMRLSTQRLTMGDLTTGLDPHRVSSQDFTTDAWADLVGAVYDSQSGVAPFRGKADRVNLASQIVWWAAQKRSAYDVLGRDAPLTQRVGYAVRSQLSAAIITGARFLLPGEMWAPDMPEHIRVLFEQFRRQVGRAPGDLAEALEHAVWVARDGGVGRDGELLAAIRGLSSRLDGLDAPISVSQNGRGFSDLDEVRGWLHEDPTPNAAAPKVSAPYRPAYDAQGALLPHDAPRTVHPVTDVVAEVTAHAGLVERILNRGVMDADTIDALAALRSRTLDAQQAASLYTRIWGMVADAQDLGMSILTAAAGKSGEDTKTRDRIAASRSDGRALDAYQSFFLGIYAHEQVPVVDAAGVAIPHPRDTSIETMVRELGASPVEMTAWVAEALNGLRVRYLTERFFDELVDHQYAVDLRMLWRDVNPGAPLPDLATRSLFANDVRRAASNILLGQDRRLLAGTTAAGVTLSPEPNQTGISGRARAAAHSMIARMGLRPDMAATRKAMKGQVVPSPIKATFGRMFYDENGALRPTPDYTALNTIDAFRPTDTVTTLYGRDLTLSTPLMERVRQLQAEQGPFGTLLANNLRDRGAAERFVDHVREYGRQYKGSLITGGPNGITAAAMAGVAFAGGVGSVGVVAALPAAALAGAVTYALTFRPRLAAYATNFVGALFQGYTEYGLKGAMRATFLPGSAKMAAAATRHSIHLTRMRAPLELAWRMIQALGDRAAGGVDHTSFVDPLGRVWTVDSVVRFGEANGLDGNMAKHESAERAQQTIDRIARTYGPQTPMGRIYNAVASFYGRHAIAENYRKVYEASDTYFRYAFLTRGLMDGANPHEAMDRARAAFFDYSDSAPIDRAFNSFFLFWMFNRRTVDLTLRTLLTEPHRVLGPLRFLNAQALRSGYEDTDADHNLAMETVPDYAIGRVAIGWLPVSSTNVNGVKIMLQEPIPVNALRTLNDIGNVDMPAILGRMNPQVQSGLNVVLGSMGAPAVSFFRKKPVESDAYWDVPMWFVKNDQDAFGGQFAEVFKWYVEPTTDPSRWIAPDYPFVYRIPAQNRNKWDVFRSLAGMGTMFNSAETDDRTGGYTQHIDSTVADFIAGMDPMNALNLRQRPADILKQGGTVVPAVDATAREFVGRDVESLRNLGISTALVQSRNGALGTMKTQVLDAAKGRLKTAKQAEWKGQPAGTVEGAPAVTPDAPLGVTPAAPIGISK